MYRLNLITVLLGYLSTLNLAPTRDIAADFKTEEMLRMQAEEIQVARKKAGF